jgi:hypothetical protein
MHTESSLRHRDEVTIALTDTLRAFQRSTSTLRTVETPRERAARARRAQDRPLQNRHTNTERLSDVRLLNLTTYKFHALADGPATVRRFGTTDSYTTQVVSIYDIIRRTWLIYPQGERQHRVPKSLYKRTSKNRDATSQVTRQDQRQRNLIQISTRHPGLLPYNFTKTYARHEGVTSLSEADLSQHQLIASSTKNWHHLSTWLNEPERASDPAFKVPSFTVCFRLTQIIQNFRQNLRNHLISRIKQENQDEDFPQFSQRELDKVSFRYGRIYPHARMRVLYTTYDLRRAVDTIDISNRPNVMAPAYYDGTTVDRHPFWYARVLGIYHADVNYGAQSIGRMEFLWVRWYAWDSTQQSGWKAHRLDRLVYDSEEYQFGFLDPAVVIRAAHLIPAWAHAKTGDYYPSSSKVEPDGDWEYHYVNRWVSGFSF